MIFFFDINEMFLYVSLSFEYEQKQYKIVLNY